MVDGILNINKPAGKTSYGVVALVKHLTGERHAGHAGTLDPDATGVLPVCLGQGTRIVEFLMDATKTYRAEIELGKTTDTYDGSGEVIQQRSTAGIDDEQLEEALESFHGDIEQIPPMYSAVKHQGQPLYKLARSGVNVPRKKRKVKIHRLELISWQPPLATLEIECSKGTYIRSLANDLGEVLGCGAYLKKLIRSRVGIFDIRDAVSLPKLEADCKKGKWQHHLYPMDSMLQDFSKIIINEAGENAIKTGSLIKPEHIEEREIKENPHHRYCRAYSREGHLLGMLLPVTDSDAWQPKKVFI